MELAPEDVDPANYKRCGLGKAHGQGALLIKMKPRSCFFPLAENLYKKILILQLF